MIRKLSTVALVALVIGGAVVAGAPGASAAGPLARGTTTMPDATRAHPYTFQLQAQGGVAPYTFEPGSAWATYGLSLSPSGFVSGTPTGDPSVDYIVGLSVTVRDSADPPASIAMPLQLTIRSNFRITTPALPAGAAGAPYAAQLSATAGTTPFKFAKGSSLPAGLKLSKAGLLSGVPKWGGTYSITVLANDAIKNRTHFAMRTYSMTISGAPKGGGGGTSGSGSVPPFAATGDLSCSGGVTIKAAGAGSPNPYVTARIKGNIHCTGGTGNARVTVTGGQVLGGYGLGQICDVLGDKPISSNASFLPFTILWKTKGGKIFSSSVAFDGHRATAGGWAFPIPGGTSTVTGSYAGTGTAAAGIQTSVSQLQGLCSGAPAHITTTGLFLLRV